MSIRRPVAGAAWLILQPLALNVLTVPATAYIIRKLGPAGYGQWSAAAALTAAVLVLTNLGVRTIFVRAIAQNPESAPQAFAEQLGLRVLLALGASIVAIFACLVMHYPPAVMQCTLIGSLGLLCCGVASSVSDLLYAFERLGESAGITLIQGLILTGCSVAVAYKGLGPVGLAWAYLLGPLTAAVMSLWLVQRKFFPVRFHWSLPRFFSLLRESRALAAQLTVGAVTTNVESLLVPKLMGIVVFGQFSAGLLPANRLTVISDGLSTAFYPIIARKWTENPAAAVREALRFLGLSVGICVLLAVGGALVAGPAAEILFPKNPALCRMVISITVWALPLHALAEGIAYTLNACGKHGLQARLGMCAMPFGLAGSVGLIYSLGIPGACWSWVLRPVIDLLFYVPAFFKVFGPLLATTGQMAPALQAQEQPHGTI
jgi:O-antigen/teichoic acid export membrane protein